MAAKKTTKKAVAKAPRGKKAIKVTKKPKGNVRKIAEKVKKVVETAIEVKEEVQKAVEEKAIAKKAAARKVAAKKGVAKRVSAKKGAAKKVVAKKVSAKKSRGSSLVATPPPSAPARPKFVPPTASAAPKASPEKGAHSSAFIEKQKNRLMELRDTLVDAMTGMTRDTIRNAPEGSDASGSGQHQGDAGSDAYDRDFALSVLAKEQDALYEIEQALMRIKAGSYGSCEISGRKIPTMRLEAIPFARLTVECQADWEKEYGNRRFKPSDEVGFSGGQPQGDEDSVTVSLDEDDE